MAQNVQAQGVVGIAQYNLQLGVAYLQQGNLALAKEFEDIVAAVALTGNPEAASPIPGPTAGQGDLASLLSTLRKPTMTIQPMRGASRGAV